MPQMFPSFWLMLFISCMGFIFYGMGIVYFMYIWHSLKKYQVVEKDLGVKWPW